MQINFTGNKPEKTRYSYAVKQNNNSNTITFVLNRNQIVTDEGIYLENLTAFAKIKGSEIIDKVPLPVEYEGEEEIKYELSLKRKHTSSRVLDIQLQFEGQGDVVWQTEIVQLVLSDTIKADEYIENKYPAVLVDHEERLQNHEARVTNAENQLVVQEAEITALDEKIAQALAGVFHYKGSVATYNDLPTEGQEVGDTYNVLDTGDNYTWNGSDWDKLSGIVDLSDYYTSSETDTLLDEKADKEELAYFVDLNSEQSISGEKTFNNIKANKLEQTRDYLQIGKADTGAITVGGREIQTNAPFTSNGAKDLGTSNKYWGNFFLRGSINFSNPNSPFTYKLFESEYGRIRCLSVNNNVENERFEIQPSNNFIINSHLFPRGNNYWDLGTSIQAWKDLYLSGKLKDGTNEVSVSEIANGIFNVINATDITNNTLTQEQYDLITNGKKTLISKTLLGYKDILIEGVLVETNYTWLLFTSNLTRGALRITNSTLAITIPSYSSGVCVINNIGTFNGKIIPAYPTDTTKNYTLKFINGQMVWVEDN